MSDLEVTLLLLFFIATGFAVWAHVGWRDALAGWRQSLEHWKSSSDQYQQTINLLLDALREDKE